MQIWGNVHRCMRWLVMQTCDTLRQDRAAGSSADWLMTGVSQRLKKLRGCLWPVVAAHFAECKPFCKPSWYQPAIACLIRLSSLATRQGHRVSRSERLGGRSPTHPPSITLRTFGSESGPVMTISPGLTADTTASATALRCSKLCSSSRCALLTSRLSAVGGGGG